MESSSKSQLKNKEINTYTKKNDSFEIKVQSKKKKEFKSHEWYHNTKEGKATLRDLDSIFMM